MTLEASQRCWYGRNLIHLVDWLAEALGGVQAAHMGYRTRVPYGAGGCKEMYRIFYLFTNTRCHNRPRLDAGVAIWPDRSGRSIFRFAACIGKRVSRDWRGGGSIIFQPQRPKEGAHGQPENGPR